MQKRWVAENGNALIFLVIILAFIAVGLFALSYITTRNKTPLKSVGAPAARNGRLNINTFEAVNPYGILSVRIAYDSTKNPSLSITNYDNKLGFAPRLPAIITPYRLQLVDAAGKTLYSMPLAIPNTYPDDTTLTTANHKGSVFSVPSINFSEAIPAITHTATIKIVDSQGQLITSKAIAQAAGGSGNPLVYQVASAPQDNVYHFIFVSDSYDPANLKEFHDDADKFKNYLLTIDPFSKHQAQVQFMTIENTTDLECKTPPNAPPNSSPIICNTDKIVALVDKAKVPYDVVVTLIKDPKQKGAWFVGTPFSFVSNGGPAPERTFVHEIGHDFGALWDEYTVGDTGDITNATDKNCLKGSPPSNDWKNVVSDSDYNKGCYHDNWYRSSSQSIMSTTGVDYYNAISRKIIEERFTALPINGKEASGSATPSATPVVTPSATPQNTASPSGGLPPIYAYAVGCKFGAVEQPDPSGLQQYYYANPLNHTFAYTANGSSCPAGTETHPVAYPVDPNYLSGGKITCNGADWWQGFDLKGFNPSVIGPPQIYYCRHN